MAMILYNPTNEDMVTQYIGETVIIEGELHEHLDSDGNPRKPKCKVRVDDPRGKHILNTLGPRGLMALEYGDEGAGEDTKRQQGIERNKAFKRKQIIDFNTYNEQRFQARQPYLTPTKQQQEYAKELGIGLREPYNVEDAAMKEMAALKDKLEKKSEEVLKKDDAIGILQAQVSELSSLVNKMIEKGAGAAKEQADSSPPDSEKVDTESGDTVDLRKLSKANMAQWLLANWNLYQNYPDEQKSKIAKRYETVYEENMPATKAELEKIVLKMAA